MWRMAKLVNALDTKTLIYHLARKGRRVEGYRNLAAARFCRYPSGSRFASTNPAPPHLNLILNFELLRGCVAQLVEQ